MAHDITAAERLAVAERAGYRCEYCRIHENSSGFSHQINHVISRKHGGSSNTGNLAYACILCNRYKGTDVAALDRYGETVPLFNPRRHLWRDHFRLDGEIIQPLKPVGEVTARLLRLNTAERTIERRLLQDLDLYPRH